MVARKPPSSQRNPSSSSALALPTLGCSKCRYAAKGCGQCRNPEYQARKTRKRPASTQDAANPPAALATRLHTLLHTPAPASPPTTDAAAPSASTPFLLQLAERQAEMRRRRIQHDPHPPSIPGSTPPTSQPTTPTSGVSPRPDPRRCLWTPPQSPYSLIEEVLYHNPWKLLLACMLLNKTSGKQVRKVLSALFALCPTPEAAVGADVLAIQSIIQPLGLFRKRAVAIQRFSHEYLYKDWLNPQELFGVGKYASDAYLIFCRGCWRDVQPDDKDLKRYHAWLVETDGQGEGLARDPPL